MVHTSSCTLCQTYLLNGCEGDFDNHFAAEVELAAKTSQSKETLRVSTNVLLTLSGSCGVAALVIGFVAGSQKKSLLA